MKTIHLLQAVQAAKLFEKGACYAKGTKQVHLDIEKVTCPKCREWDRNQGLMLTDRGRQTLRECGYDEAGYRL